MPVTGSPDDLVPLWTAAMPRLAYAGPEGLTWEALPPWKRWPETTRRLTIPGQLSADTYHLVGALGAYYGELLRAHYPRPLHWQIFRYPHERIAEEGQLVLASAETQRKGLPWMWIAPTREVTVMANAQLREPLAPGEQITGKDDPYRLHKRFARYLDDAGRAAT